ncbi:MAG: DNA mismatch endonuclease Vsr [Deltaproteobacteria bacterium]
MRGPRRRVKADDVVPSIAILRNMAKRIHRPSVPKPSSPEAEARMRRTQRRDTKCEVEIRRRLHARGLRYRVDRRVLDGLRRRADIVFGPRRVAVFVDGCFWHGCPLHATWPKANATFWKEKINTNRTRDRDTDRRLVDAGWMVVRVWEHVDPDYAADRIVSILETCAETKQHRCVVVS